MISPTGYVIMLAFSILYYRVAEAENRSGIVWGSFSALAFGLAYYLNTGSIGMFIGQVLIYIAMWGLNCFRPLSDI